MPADPLTSCAAGHLGTWAWSPRMLVGPEQAGWRPALLNTFIPSLDLTAMVKSLLLRCIGGQLNQAPTKGRPSYATLATSRSPAPLTGLERRVWLCATIFELVIFWVSSSFPPSPSLLLSPRGLHD